MVKIVVTNAADEVVEIDARPGWSLMENIRDLPSSVEAICGGMCACATCHVYIDPSSVPALPPRRYEEVVMLQDLLSYDPEMSRLSCQIRVTDQLAGLRVKVAPTV
jgi:2Fe-2S ferredoxin